LGILCSTRNIVAKSGNALTEVQFFSHNENTNNISTCSNCGKNEYVEDGFNSVKVEINEESTSGKVLGCVVCIIYAEKFCCLLPDTEGRDP